MWAIIGGSGFESFSGFEIIEELDIVTPFGATSEGLKKVRLNGCEIIFLPRHGKHHDKLPHEVNYRANIFALKKLGVSKILSVSAVGSLRHELNPGNAVVPNQYINRTLGLRKHTFCGDGIVGHVSLAHPISDDLAHEVEKISSKLDFTIHFNKIYVCMEGPCFSTRAESHSYRQMNADIVGMTNFPEYALAREAGICYLPISFVTDYDSWQDDIPHVTLSQVMQIMRENNAKAFQLASSLIPATQHLFTNGCHEQSLANSLMSSTDHLTAEQKSWLNMLLSKPL